jgi:hypothetical protein
MKVESAPWNRNIDILSVAKGQARVVPEQQAECLLGAQGGSPCSLNEITA